MGGHGKRQIGLSAGTFPFFAGIFPVAAVAAFFALPYCAAMAGAFGPAEGGLPGRVWGVAAWTAAQAALSAFLAAALALPAAYLASSPAFRGRNWLLALGSIPFALPPILMGLGFVLFWGNSGAVNRTLGAFFGGTVQFSFLYNPGALIFCHATYNFPLVLRLAADAFSRVRAAYTAPAYTLGASPARMFWTVSLPAAFPAILSAALLVFLYSFTSFSIVLLLGGVNASTLAVEIYRFACVNLDFHTAGVLALIETGIAALVFAGYLAIERRIAVESPPDSAIRLNQGTFFAISALPFRPGLAFPSKAGSKSAIRRQKTGLSALIRVFRFAPHPNSAPIPCAENLENKGLCGKKRWIKAPSGAFAVTRRVYAVALALVILGPVLAVVCDSFLIQRSRAGGAVFSLARYTDAGARLAGACARSLALAALAASLACVMAFLAAEAVLGTRRAASGRVIGELTRWMAAAPAASSGITLGLGIFLLYGRDAARTALMAALAQAVLALPFAYHAVYMALRSIPERLFDTASVYGASPLRRVLTVDIPLCGGGLRAAWAFSACVSLGELNTILMLGIEGWETLPLYIYRAAAAYRFGAAAAAGAILILCCLIIFTAAGRGGAQSRHRAV